MIINPPVHVCVRACMHGVPSSRTGFAQNSQGRKKGPSILALLCCAPGFKPSSTYHHTKMKILFPCWPREFCLPACLPACLHGRWQVGVGGIY